VTRKIFQFICGTIACALWVGSMFTPVHETRQDLLLNGCLWMFSAVNLRKGGSLS